jgi:hypothetical protein
MSSRPALLPDEQIDLTRVKKLAREYLDLIETREWIDEDDMDYSDWMFEAIMTALYGNEVFTDFINKVTTGG